MHPNRPLASSWAQMSANNMQQQQQQQQQPEFAAAVARTGSNFSSGSSSTTSGQFMAGGLTTTAGLSAGTHSMGGTNSGPVSLTSSSSIATTNSSTTHTTADSSQLMVSAQSSLLQQQQQQQLDSNDLLLQQQQQEAANEEQRQEENRKLRLQLYVFVLRCISYPFNAKQTNISDLHHKQQQLKLRKQQLEQIVQLHTRFIKFPNAFAANKTPHQHLKLTSSQLRHLDELYERAHVRFNRKFLQNERMRLLVESECCSQQDLRELFRQNVEQIFKESNIFSNESYSIRRAGASGPNRLVGGGGTVVSSRRDFYSSSSSDLESNVIRESSSECSHANLVANKEVIMNSWLIKFESIIREDSDALSLTGSAGAGSQLTGPTATGMDPSTSSGSGALVSVTGSGPQQTNGSQQQQQQFSKEQLYQMFQNILNIKKFEHQLLYNALQLDSSDEQAAAIRRELDGRVSRIAELERNKKLLPKFVLKEMESLYFEEARMSVNKLMVNLDSLPVMKGSNNESRGVYGLQKFRRYNSRAQASLTRDGLVESHPSEPTLTKLDVVLTFNIEVIVMEVRGLRHLAPQREIYCTMEIEGSERLQTEHVQAKKPLWDTQGDFTTSHPLPILKIKLYAVNPSMLSLEDKELGKLVLRPTVLSPKTPEWCTMVPTTSSSNSAQQFSGQLAGSGVSASASGSSSSSQEDLKIRVIVRMDRPQQLKHCGYLYGIGKSTWRKFKRRYHILIQVSQYTFVMCSYREKKSKPTEMLQLDGYTVDYIEPPTDLIMEHCSEMTSNELHGNSHHSGSSTLGLAGRLANVILKQPVGSSANAGAGSEGGNSRGSGSAGSGLAGSSGLPLDLSGDSATGSGGQGGQDQDQQPSAIQTAAALSDELHNKYYFNVVKEGDSVVFACDDEQECFGWVMALYRATGQAHKPTPLRNQYSGSTSHYIDAAFAYQTSANQPTKLVGNSSLSGSSMVGSMASMLNGVKGTKSSVDVADQRARKHGMDEFISADPCKFQHNQLFKYLQNETLRYRLNDRFCSLGWFSPGQILVLDEYCARYGVRTCFRHLAYLNSLLDFNQRGYFIDHTLLNYGYDFCASHVSGNSGQAHPIGSVNFDLRPDGVGTVTHEERDMFYGVKSKLLKMIERQISNFSYCFPFGKPDGALKATLSLLERVLMKEQQTNSMVQNEEVRNLIRKCLEQAALNNYTKLSGQANLLVPPPNGSTPPPAPPPHMVPVSSASDQSGTETTGQQQQDTPSTPLASIGARLRTASNLSASSVASYASSSVASSTGSGQHSSIAGNSSGGGPNDSFRRQQQRTVNATTAARQAVPVQGGSAHQDTQQCLTMAMIINNEHMKAGDKLRHLIRLAELCCEQVEENNEYFSDAFAWHSDLMMDHFELFWSLFSVDMDKILNELGGSGNQNQATNPMIKNAGNANQQQPGSLVSLSGRSTGGSFSAASGGSADLLGANNRDAFSLFQVLNNHMHKSPNLECRKFKAYLCETFKPKLLRYIDIMESTLTRMLFKACEKESQVNCAMVERLFIKLDDLQKFVFYHLKWPDDQLAEQLNQRLKLMAYELCDACVQRTQSAFQQLERKSNKWTATTTSYVSPIDMIQMINLVLDTRNRSLKLCTFNNFDQMSYHSKIDKLVEGALGEMQPGLMAKMLNALDSTLTKLARYDEGNLLAPILSLTTKQGMSSSGKDIGKQYVTFVSNCCDVLRHKINDELWIVNLLEDWYATQMNIICSWLGERIDRSLHEVQLLALTSIMPKIYADMSLQGVPEEKLNLKTYQTIMSRLKMEEAAAMAGGSLFEQPSSSSIFNTSILSSLTSSTSGAQSSSGNNGIGGGQQQVPSSIAALATPIRQPSSFQQQQQQQKPDSPGGYQRPQVRQLGSQSAASMASMAATSGYQQQQQQLDQSGQPTEGDNIADRALQSATRMFKGFWAN